MLLSLRSRKETKMQKKYDYDYGYGKKHAYTSTYKETKNEYVRAEEKYIRKEERKGAVRKAVRIIVFFSIILASIALFYFTYIVAYDTPVNKTDKTLIEFSINAGNSKTDIENRLYDEGLISDINLFRIREILFKADYKTGTYRLKRSYNNEKIINILSGVEYDS